MKYDHDTTVKVFGQERYDGEWLPETLAEAIAWFQAHLDSIPEQYRASATLEIESVGSWENTHYPHISIEYRRPATAEEIEERKQRAAADATKQLEWAKSRVAQEQARLNALLP